MSTASEEKKGKKRKARIRAALLSDMQAVTDIFNFFVRESYSAYPVDEVPADRFVTLHRIVTAFFVSGGGSEGNFPGLIFVLAIFAGIVLLFTGKYPQSIFKLVIGLNRWVYRVAAYVTLMTDEYPPFRLWDD